ncbi:SusC/RagA family TonB-linked outer membrane protein [Limnovirga soli]|uniref:SusC/RagA family TonB-linked outer membrane protein n=1 Tax=Limnovirga soli TaxID=2656915 RepID=A0A8J8FM05_9BACT|nr:TonB-dependent receptor [Limnovirga soli]NNV57324.1 SusC/RagA family TonB-linked outer membrane protein [Limnovirga soli]
MNGKKLLMAFVLFLFTATAMHSHAQTAEITVKGKITGKDGLPLPGVSIVVKGKSKAAALSDADGTFSLKTKEASGVLVFSTVGYSIKELAFNGAAANLSVQLEESVSVLNDVVLTGYIKQKKSDITGAISSVRNKDFKDQPVVNIAQSIQGKVAGILVTTPSGTPGAGLLVSVRGSSNPLYVVDGVPMISESNSSLATSYNTDGEVVGQGQNISSIADINPDDIESLEVLKDASSASIYGARAANGVVLITTKRGKSGKTDFSFNSYTGVQNVARVIPFLSSADFVALTEDARAQDYTLYQQDPSLFGDDFDSRILTNPLPSSWNTGVNTNWLNEIFHTAPISNIQLSARGGNDKTRFFIAGNYFDQQGTVIENSYKRGSFRINLDNKVSERVSIGASASFTYSRNHRSFNDNAYTGIVTNAIGASPLEPVYNEDGSFSDYTEYQASWLSDNPVKSAKKITAYTSSYRFIGTVFADVDVVNNLKFRSSFSTDYSNINDDQFFDPSTTDGVAVGGKAIKGLFRNTTWINENTLTYQNTFKEKNSLTVLGGFSVQSSKINASSIRGQGFPAGSGLQNISSASSITAASDINTGWGLVSFLARANYSYDSKYLLSASARYDGSSRFNPSGRWGVFPAVSAGWVLTREAFLDHSKWLTNLKIRASYGLTGDQEIGNFQYLSYWSPGRYDGYAGLRPRNLGNNDLTWQRNKMFNIGADFEIAKGKFSGSVEYFKGNRTKLLANAVLPATSGFSSLTINSGNVENSGVEFSLNAYVIKKKDFNWNASFNISFIKNRIKSLYSDNELINAYTDLFPTHILKVGEAVGSFWGIQYDGVDPQTGDPIYNDLNKDGVIDDADSRVLGKATPDFFGGLTNDFRYKNWDMSIATQFSVGSKVYNLIRATYQTLGWSDQGWDENGDLYQVYANNAAIVNNRWKNPGDKTDIPRASLIFQNYLQNSSQFIEDASFFRIRTVNLGYNIRPKSRKVFSSLRVYAQVQNLFVLTNYYGFDPEVSSNGGDAEQTAGVDYAAYPQARTITFGVNLNF